MWLLFRQSATGCSWRLLARALQGAGFLRAARSDRRRLRRQPRLRAADCALTSSTLPILPGWRRPPAARQPCRAGPACATHGRSCGGATAAPRVQAVRDELAGWLATEAGLALKPDVRVQRSGLGITCRTASAGHQASPGASSAAYRALRAGWEVAWAGGQIDALRLQQGYAAVLAPHLPADAAAAPGRLCASTPACVRRWGG